jgi:hypothetical protein
VAAEGESGLFPLGNCVCCFIIRKRERALCGKIQQSVQFALQQSGIRRGSLGRENKETEQSFCRKTGVRQVSQENTAVFAVQRFDFRGGTGGLQLLAEQIPGGGFVLNEMAAAEHALVDRLQKVLRPE